MEAFVLWCLEQAGDPAFWVAVSTVLFGLLGGKKLLGEARSFLDDRSTGIRNGLDALENAKAEAQRVLDQSRQHRDKARAQAESWVRESLVQSQAIRDETRTLMNQQQARAQIGLESALKDMKVRMMQEWVDAVLRDTGQELARRKVLPLFLLNSLTDRVLH